MPCYRSSDVEADEDGGGGDEGDEKIKTLRKCVGGLKIKFAMSSRQTKYYEINRIIKKPRRLMARYCAS